MPRYVVTYIDDEGKEHDVKVEADNVDAAADKVMDEYGADAIEMVDRISNL